MAEVCVSERMAPAVVFPGQGSQRVGMAAAYAGEDGGAVAAAVAEVGEAIGVDLAAVIADETDGGAALNLTVNTQPAMLAVGVGVWRAAAAVLPAPVCMAGHSLGEYAALVCAGALTLAEAAGLVRRRAEYMQEAVEDGGMAAVLGLESVVVERVCGELRSDGWEVWPANYNSATQVVLAGRREAVRVAAARLKEVGAKRAVMLPMSVPSHCPLLGLAAARFRDELSEVDWRSPEVTVLHCAAMPDDESGAPLIVQRLVRQLVMPVYWNQMLGEMRRLGATVAVECGPGRALTGLGRGSGLPHVAVDGAAALAGLVEKGGAG